MSIKFAHDLKLALQELDALRQLVQALCKEVDTLKERVKELDRPRVGRPPKQD